MKRWMVQLTSRQLKTLKPEQLELGTLVSSSSGSHYLLFRDDFVALKVARGLGAKRSRALTLPETSTLYSAPIAQLDDGAYLFAEA